MKKKGTTPPISKGIFKSKPKDVTEGKPTRAGRHHGATTQGGSDFGQGSLQLPGSAVRQGAESNDGANYDGEKGWNIEALRKEDIPVTRKKAPPAGKDADATGKDEDAAGKNATASHRDTDAAGKDKPAD